MRIKFIRMTARYKNVVLCKGLSEKSDTQETYIETLKASGYTCDCIRTLQFEFVNLSDLRACLLSPHTYLGLILTSRRTVEAISLASKENGDILHPWKSLPIYCVGPATESLAKSQLGIENCLGSETGNAKDLTEKIIACTAKEPKPLLYPCSEIARETIEQILKDNGISVKKVIVYKTLRSKYLEQDLLRLLDSIPRIFVFFSPSTVEHIEKILKQKSYDIKSIKAAAIGPTTRKALIEAGFNIYAMADKPEPISLLQAIRNAEKDDILQNTS